MQVIGKSLIRNIESKGNVLIFEISNCLVKAATPQATPRVEYSEREIERKRETG